MSELAIGEIGVYRGSLDYYHGILFTVASSYGDRCDLAYEDEPGEVVLRNAHSSSLRIIDKADFLVSICKVCGDGPMWHIRDEPKECPTYQRSGVRTLL
ncbi:hypothetical protein ABT299_44380 [Spirillospora sp. NPDC000708]